MSPALDEAAGRKVAAVPVLDLAHDEARRALATGAPVHLAVNPVEYHGPHLSLHNDRLLARGVAQDLHVRLARRHPEWQFLVMPDLEAGVEPTPGVGSRFVPFPVVRGLVLEACRAALELGARRVVLHTFHGAPLHNLALEAGAKWLRARGVQALAPFHLVVRESIAWRGAARFAAALATIADPTARAQVADGLQYDFHAGFFETSLTLHYAPASVSPRYRTLPPCPRITPLGHLVAAARAARALGRHTVASELEFAAMGMGWSALRPFPGYTGQPALANAAAGAVFAAHIVDVYEAAVLGYFDGKQPPPAPIMPWAEAASLGGRVGGNPRLTAADLQFA